jgi:hypothetical protein
MNGRQHTTDCLLALCTDVWFHGSEEEIEDLLMLHPPREVRGVRDGGCSMTHTLKDHLG